MASSVTSRPTFSWWLGSTFRSRYPAVDLDTGQTLVRAEGISTAGAAFAHIDLALSLMHVQSPALADLVARYLLVGDRVSQASFAVPTMLARNSPEMAAFERWVRSHLGRDAARARPPTAWGHHPGAAPGSGEQLIGT
ncbi:hypothetical protein [Pseudonocardia sp. H11422]|uniref:hypothetical protein n=1 Tax=Pseudonocardia sp. H11422 TaxID=2835866 RepID=UPI001BDD05A0|nr:hypothetical protein [Pseudonocardia sp. H11422]